MSQYSTTPEYTLEESGRTLHTEKVHRCLSLKFKDVQEDFLELCQALTMLEDTLGGIHAKLHILEQSLEEQS